MRRSMAALCLLVVFPFTASALGLGDITLDSALNQPFSAEIPLNSYEEADLDAISVGLASEATFKRYGLDQPAFLLDFEFRVKRTASGAPVVSITSLQPVSEPFVTLLLDIKWASGRLLREYTVLVDPPLFESQPVQTAVTAAATTAPADSAAVSSNQGVATGQVSRAPEPASASVSTSTSTSTSKPAPAPRPTQAAPQTSSQSSNTGSTSETAAAPATMSGEYSVQRRDTLWGIAQRVKGDLTTNQVMLAMYRANPEAFLGNINRLKAGAILRVPQQNELSELTPAEATAAVREQNAAVSQSTAASAASARLTLVAPAEDSATGINEDAAAADPAATSGAVDSTLEAAAQEVESGQMRGRISELETELTDSRRLIDAQDAELAALQRRLQALESSAATDSAVAEQVAGDIAADVDTEATAEDPLFADQGDAADSLLNEPSDAVADTGEDVATAVVADSTTSVPAREESSSFFAELLSNLWFWVSAAVVLLLALFVVRRGKNDDESDLIAEQDAEYAKTIGDLEALPEAEGAFVVDEAPVFEAPVIEAPELPTSQASVIDEDATVQAMPPYEAALDTADNAESPSIFDADPGAYEATGATAELSAAEEVDVETPLEKTTSIGAPLNLDKADPIAETDFHMAYGLYDQTADLLEQSLASEPDNRGYRVKLVEVFFVWENREGFLKHAKILNESVDDVADADWNKVVILGKQLCPDEEMFSGAETAAPAADSMDFEISDSGEAELDFTIAGDDADSGVISEDLAVDGGDDADEADLDFDLGGGTFETAADNDLTVDLGDETVAVDDSAATMETPTIEVGSLNGGDTIEAPTIESPLAGTDGSATLEAPAAAGEAETAEMTALSPEVFDAEGVDLDLGGADDLDVDLSALDDDDEDIEATLLADAESEDEDEDEDEAATLLTDSGDLEAEIEAELDAQADESGSDTVEQPQLDTVDAAAGDTAEQPALAGNAEVDFDLGMEVDGEDEMAAAVDDAALPEDATMTEVGTKLDLARAYIDMGDPDGARSILGEVLDEGGDDQQQEARQLLEELGD